MLCADQLITGFIVVAFVLAFFVGNPRPREGGEIMEYMHNK
jgi:hypothetical protein